ncbi:hypothetical protein M5J74_09060 [Chroococcidiopsis sp. CCNUC1]|nr:hypothetical protein [Chroococcidiopsis sp. CCNUC1]URD52126.1 hypothetical protein M5J74_09060 [Chroococcidiopsis sp. CCNUC1]
MSYTESQLEEAVISVAGLTSYIQLLLEHDEVLRQVWVGGKFRVLAVTLKVCF